MQQLQGALAEWLRSFPEGRAWIPLLLVSHAGAVPESAGSIGPVLWEWREEPLAEDWLRESDDCRDPQDKAHDLIVDARASLVSLGAHPWGVTAEQHADLLAWCDRMMARRAELKAAEKK